MSWQTVIDSGLLDGGESPTQDEVDAAGLSDEDLQLVLRWFSRLTANEPVPVRLDADTLRAAQRQGVVYAKHGTPGDPDYPHGDGGGGGDNAWARVPLMPQSPGDPTGRAPHVRSRLERFGIDPAAVPQTAQELQAVVDAIGPTVPLTIGPIDQPPSVGAVYDRDAHHITLNAEALALGGHTAATWGHIMLHENAHGTYARALDAPVPKGELTVAGYVWKNREALAEQDGTTSYSRDWWSTYNEGPPPGAHNISPRKMLSEYVVNETFADMAATDTWGGGAWRDLHDFIGARADAPQLVLDFSPPDPEQLPLRLRRKPGP